MAESLIEGSLEHIAYCEKFRFSSQCVCMCGDSFPESQISENVFISRVKSYVSDQSFRSSYDGK